MGKLSRSFVVIAAVTGGLPFAAVAADDLATPQPATGQALYRRYCGACHGPDGKGDGVASSLMRPAPPDLTRLAARHGGTFPEELLVKTIDGREMPRAHGDPAMPVWGDVLSEEMGSRPAAKNPAIERRVHGRITAIVEYVRGLQVK